MRCCLLNKSMTTCKRLNRQLTQAVHKYIYKTTLCIEKVNAVRGINCKTLFLGQSTQQKLIVINSILYRYIVKHTFNF